MSDRLDDALAALAEAIRAEVRAQAANGHAAPDRLLTVREAAEAAGVGRTLIYDLIGSGRLRSVRLGRRRLVPAGAIAELTQAPPETR